MKSNHCSIRNQAHDSFWIAIALSTALATGCEFGGFSEPVLTNALVSLAVVPESDPMFADGASQARITVTLDGSLADGTIVRIQVGSGTLFGGPTDSGTTASTPATGHIAELLYRSGQRPGDVAIQASAAGLIQDTVLQLILAAPDSVQIRSDRTEALADGKTPVTLVAELFRGAGRVSQGIPVEFIVVDSVTGVTIPGLSRTITFDGTTAPTYNITSKSPDTLQVWAAAAGATSDPIVIRFSR